jgi:hypothetical protein
MTRIAAKVAESKRLHPERYCPAPHCLWRTCHGFKMCPKHHDQYFVRSVPPPPSEGTTPTGGKAA